MREFVVKLANVLFFFYIDLIVNVEIAWEFAFEVLQISSDFIVTWLMGMNENSTK